MRNFQIFIAVFICAINCCASSAGANGAGASAADYGQRRKTEGVNNNSAEWLMVRRDDALTLTEGARKLSAQASELLAEARAVSALGGSSPLGAALAFSGCSTPRAALPAKQPLPPSLLSSSFSEKRQIAAADGSEKPPYDLEVRESIDRSNADHPRRIVAPESMAILRNYTDLLARYKAALAAYVRHRQSVQEHAAAFHAQAQQSTNSPPPLMAVPEFRMLQVQAQDACSALQQAEAELHSIESQLFGVIQALIQNQKTMGPNQYATVWTESESKASQLQRNVNGFNQGVLQKQETIQSMMHEKTSQAMRDGDYVESQKVFAEHERNSALLHEEFKRANQHTTMAIQFLNQLQTISPYAQNPAQGSQAGFQFVEDDKDLATEFEQVQQLYKQVQAAAPKFH